MTPRPVLIHYHIFKNAGTSFDQALVQSFGPDRWRPFEGAHAHDVLPAARVAAFLDANPGVVALSTHLARPPLPWKGCCPVVFLRHPIDRAKSVFEFTAADATQPTSAEARALGFRGYVEWALGGGRGGVVIRDYQVIHLSDASFRYAHILEAKAGTADYFQAKAVLSAWPVVGVVDEYDRSLQLFQETYGRHFPDLALRSMRLNTTSRGTTPIEQKVAAIRAELGAALFARLVAANQLDLELYEFARRRLAGGEPVCAVAR